MKRAGHKGVGNIWYGVLIGVAFLAINIAVIQKYGLDFDSGVHAARGEALLHFLLTGETDYRHLPAGERCIFQETDPAYPFLTPAFFFNEYAAGTTIGGLTSALTCRVFHKRLGWLGAVDAHNLSALLYGALTVLALYLFALEALGKKEALLAALALALYPAFIGYSHIDIKDMPVLFFSSLTIWFFRRGICHRSYGWLWMSLLAFGLAMVSKHNGAFALIVVAAWTGTLLFVRRRVFFRPDKRFWALLLGGPLVATLIYIACAPKLWDNNPRLMLQKTTRVAEAVLTMRYVKRKTDPAQKGGVGEGRWRPYYAPMHALLTMPLPLLFLSLLGLGRLWKEKETARKETLWLVFLWAATPVLFCTFPFLKVYDSIRQFMIFLPGVCLLAGAGGGEFACLVEKHTGRELLAAGALGLLIAGECAAVRRYHPFELTFFNSLIGGLRGAQEIRIPGVERVGIPDAGDVRGTSIRLAMDWVNRKGRTGSLLMLYATHANKFLLRNRGVALLPYLWDKSEQGREGVRKMEFSAVYLVFPNNYWNRLHPVYGYCVEKLEPLFTNRAAGAPVSWVYSMSREEFLSAVFPRQTGS